MVGGRKGESDDAYISIKFGYIQVNIYIPPFHAKIPVQNMHHCQTDEAAILTILSVIFKLKGRNFGSHHVANVPT